MNVDEAVELDYETILKKTDKAWQVRFSPTQICWVPKSQARIFNNNLYVSRWIVKEKGLESYEVK